MMRSLQRPNRTARGLLGGGLLCLALLVVALGSSGVAGRGAGPFGATPEPSPEFPRSVECTLAPRTAEELRALAPGGSRIGFTPRPPAVIDQQLLADIEEAVRLYIACINSGELDRLYSLYTDDFLRTIQIGDLYLVENVLWLNYMATPQPVQVEYRWPMPDEIEIRANADGTVAAGLSFTQSGDSLGMTLIFRWVDGRWLIDDTRAGDTGQYVPRDPRDFLA